MLCYANHCNFRRIFQLHYFDSCVFSAAAKWRKVYLSIAFTPVPQGIIMLYKPLFPAEYIFCVYTRPAQHPPFHREHR
jgi:hypothetical protein